MQSVNADCDGKIGYGVLRHPRDRPDSRRENADGGAWYGWIEACARYG